MAIVELAVSLMRMDCLTRICADQATRTAYWEETLAAAELAKWLSQLAPSHLYLGSEFCEHLMPSADTLRIALRRAEEHQLALSLLTPVASPQVIRNLADLLPALPSATEVIVNDWGVAYFLREHFPEIRAIAGRILCRMIKDPRLVSHDWAPQCEFDAAPLQAMFKTMGFQQMEIDVPAFAEADVFVKIPMRKSVHLPFSYIAKGRMCRDGSLASTGPERFAVGRKCKKECLGLSAVIKRPGTDDRYATYRVGNTIFSRHSQEMLDVVVSAVKNGHIDRLVVPGDPL